MSNEPNPVQEPTPQLAPAVQPTNDPSPGTDPVQEPVTWERVESLLKTRTEALAREVKKLGKAAAPATPTEPTAPDPAALTAEAERRADLALDLMAAGMSKDMARRMSRADSLLPEGWDTSDEVVAYLKGEMPGAFAPPNTTRAPGGGGGRNAAPASAEPYSFDADGVNQAKAELSASAYVTWYNKNREAIAAGNGLTIKKHPGIPGALTPAGGARS